MGRLIPQQTVDALRSFNSLSVGIFGIDCQLFIPNNTTKLEPDDIYTTVSDVTYTGLKTQVFIDWKPDMRMLRKLGMYAEGETPILCWFKNDPAITLGSYIKLDTQYTPRSYDRDEFEIVDVMNRGIYDAVVLNVYKLAPRRVKTKV